MDPAANEVRVIELPATGHMGPLERPAEVADALRELAGETGPAGSSPNHADLVQRL